MADFGNKSFDVEALNYERGRTPKSEYNTGELLPKMPYNVLSYLFDNNELIWKLLKYDDADAHTKTDLTLEEKTSMIYVSGEDMTKHRIYFDVSQDDGINAEMSFLRIHILQDVPINRLQTNVLLAFDVLTHAKINHMSNYETRVERIIQQIKEVLNGKDIMGVGQVLYDTQASRACGSKIIGQQSFKGKSAIFSVTSVTAK